MFLTEKHSSQFPLFFFPKNPKKPPPNSFEETLIARLNSLLPFPDSPTPIPLSHLPRFIHLLTLTLTDLTAVISDPSISPKNHADLSSHLDSSISLLDACNAISATINQILHGCLIARHAIHLISSSRLLRAQSAIAQWDATDSSIGLSRSRANGPNRGRKVTAVRRTIYAAEAIADLVVRLILACLGKKDGFLLGVFVAGDFAWGAAYNAVAAKVLGKICCGEIGGEIEVVKMRVKRLIVVVDGDEGNGGVTEGWRDAVCGAEMAVEELTEGMDGMGKAVNGLFRSSLESREAALECFRVWNGRCG